jgi:hypothetical protein
MGTYEKLIKRFLSRPKDFTFDEICRLLNGLGYQLETKGKTSGSRVKFYNEKLQHPILLHKPHPENIMKTYQMKDIEDELRAKGLI